MVNLIHIKATTPTIKSPAAFFISFFKIDKIREARNSFLSSFPHPEDENDYWSKHCVSVFPNEEYFEVEYFLEEFESEYEFPSRDSRIVRYSFDSELDKLLAEKFQEFKRLIQQKFATIDSDLKRKKTNGEYIRDLLKKIIQIGNEVDEYTDFTAEKPNLLRPLFAIIRYIYSHYSEFTFNPRADKFLKLALESRPENSNLIGESITLESILSIESIRYIGGGKLFLFDNTDTNLNKKFEHFYNHEVEKISDPIKISGSVMAINYLIHKICISLDYTISDIAKLNVFKINKAKLIPDLCYTDASRIGTQNPGLKDVIDLHFHASN